MSVSGQALVLPGRSHPQPLPTTATPPVACDEHSFQLAVDYLVYVCPKCNMHPRAPRHWHRGRWPFKVGELNLSQFRELTDEEEHMVTLLKSAKLIERVVSDQGLARDIGVATLVRAVTDLSERATGNILGSSLGQFAASH